MVMPTLLHPVPITVQKLDKANTIYDDDYREPVQQAARAVSVVVPGQVAWFRGDVLKRTRGGIQEDSSGYVLFRYIDLERNGLTIELNDRFVKLGTLVVDVYVNKFEPCGHYPEYQGPTMVKCFFTDREPVKQGLA